MSEMSLEEIVDKIYEVGKKVEFNCSQGKPTQDLRLYRREVKQQILSRIADLTEKVKELELENEVLREQNFAMNKNAIENKQQIADLQQKLENLKCKSVCVYCGHIHISEKAENKLNDMVDHMAVCENHPVPKLLGIIQVLQNWFVDNSKEDTTIGISINNAYVSFCRKGIFNPKFEQPSNLTREERNGKVE